MTHSLPVVLSAITALMLTGVGRDLVPTESPTLRIESDPSKVSFSPGPTLTSRLTSLTNSSLLESELSPNGTSLTVDLSSTRVGLRVRFRF